MTRDMKPQSWQTVSVIVGLIAVGGGGFYSYGQLSARLETRADAADRTLRELKEDMTHHFDRIEVRLDDIGTRKSANAGN